MPHTVLVVDWNGESRDIYGAVLRYHGFATLQAGGGTEGIRLATAHLPDLILLDLFVPGLDGWEVLRQLREDQRTASIPLILLTTYAEAAHLEALRREAAHCYAKPYPPSQLLGVVRQLLAERSADGSWEDGENSHGAWTAAPVPAARTST